MPLPREVAAGETIQLDVAFDEKLPIVVERTGFRGHYHMVGQWFPKLARLEPDGTWAHFPFHHLAEFYADYGTYDVTLDVPAAYTIGATGPVVEQSVANGRRVERHVQADVHDFAWTAWDAWQTMSKKVGPVAVTLLYPHNFKRLALREMATLDFGLRVPRLLPLRPVPVRRAHRRAPAARDAGERRRHGVPDAHHHGRRVEHAPRPPRARDRHAPRDGPPVVLWPHRHRNELAWPFLDEGLNQYAEQDGMAKWRGEASAVDFAGLTVSDSAVDAIGGVAAVHNEPVAQAANLFTTGSDYGGLVYARTASVVETMRRVYGDEAVGRALGRYARRFRFLHPGPEQLLAVFDEVLGAGAVATLRTALFEKGWVDYTVEGVWAQKDMRAAGFFDIDGQRAKVEPETPGDGGWDDARCCWCAGAGRCRSPWRSSS